jgi:hypothetical protein
VSIEEDRASLLGQWPQKKVLGQRSVEILGDEWNPIFDAL